MIEAEKERGGLYRSDDWGDKWTDVSDSHAYLPACLATRGSFPTRRTPTSCTRANVEFLKSSDGGKGFHPMPVLQRHGDNHILFPGSGPFEPDDPRQRRRSDDHVQRRPDLVDAGQPRPRVLPRVTMHRFPYWVYGAQQDNSHCSGRGRRECPDTGGITANEWYDVGGGESAWIAPDPRNPEIVYAGLRRPDHPVRPEDASTGRSTRGRSGATRDLKYRFQWNAPTIISKQNPKVLYFASAEVACA